MNTLVDKSTSNFSGPSLSFYRFTIFFRARIRIRVRRADPVSDPAESENGTERKENGSGTTVLAMIAIRCL